MQLLEGSDTRVRFNIKEIENNVTTDLNLGDYDNYKLEIQFSDDSLIEIDGVVDTTTTPNTLYFDIFSEYTDGKEGSLKADIWGVKGAKRVRFNPATIKGKVLDSVYIPDVLQND